MKPRTILTASAVTPLRERALFLLIMLLAQSAVCQENATPAPAAAPAPVPPQVQLRDPFWPVGYAPQKRDESVVATTTTNVTSQGPVAAVPAAGVIWPELKVKGLTRQADGTYLAIIEGAGVVEAGQIAKIKRDGMIFRWKITEINKKGIFKQKLDYKPAR